MPLITQPTFFEIAIPSKSWWKHLEIDSYWFDSDVIAILPECKFFSFSLWCQLLLVSEQKMNKDIASKTSLFSLGKIVISFMDFFITGLGTPMILIWEVGIPGRKLWRPKTTLSWTIISNITTYSKNSDQYLSFEMLNILLQLVEVGF